MVSLKDKDGALESIAIAQGSGATHGVNKTQLDLISDPKLQYSETSVNYNSGTVAIGTTSSNTVIHAVVVEKGAGNWTNANSTTEITVGDGSDNDRLFSGFDPDIQVKHSVYYKYTSDTALNAYVTQGGASAGSATVRIWYSGEIA